MLSNSNELEPERLRHRRLRGALALLAALAISFGAIACGSDDGGDSTGSSNTTTAEEPLSTEAYLTQVNEAQTAFATGASKLNLANPSSVKDFGKALVSLIGLVDTLREQLDDIVPPDAVSAEQDELVQHLREYGETIEQQRGALTSGDQQKAAAAAQKVSKASADFSREFDATISQINDNLGLEAGNGE